MTELNASARRRLADDQKQTRPVQGRSDRDGHVRCGPVDAVSTLRPDLVPETACLTSLPERSLAMLQSHVIDVDGAFVGAAVRLDRGYRFIATDMKLDDLDGSIWPTLADIQRLARRMYFGGRINYPAQAH